MIALLYEYHRVDLRKCRWVGLLHTQARLISYRTAVVHAICQWPKHYVVCDRTQSAKCGNRAGHFELHLPFWLKTIRSGLGFLPPLCQMLLALWDGSSGHHLSGSSTEAGCYYNPGDKRQSFSLLQWIHEQSKILMVAPLVPKSTGPIASGFCATSDACEQTALSCHSQLGGEQAQRTTETSSVLWQEYG